MRTWNQIKSTLSFTNEGNITTGYFAQMTKYIKNGYTPISICGKAPGFYEAEGFKQYKKLAPKYNFFIEWKQGIIDNDGYIVRYLNYVLRGLNPKEVYKELFELSNHNKIVLLCYEKPFDFCHRHIVADWLSFYMGIDILEMYY